STGDKSEEDFPACAGFKLRSSDLRVTWLMLMLEPAPAPLTMDLTGDLATLKTCVFTQKEGVHYQVKVTFKVHREMVSGLRCLHHTYGAAPTGAGPHVVRSLIMDDDRTDHRSWEWRLQVPGTARTEPTWGSH
ncbi:rho GDP-dissociation inhibitor 3-like, partial [Dipodomys merriami]|uniref:rho GDP-dissociation inhibitor 3-like n=1 Tax=Dipodomys merriami TaxID=94247 RepID=UPI003855F8C6